MLKLADVAVAVSDAKASAAWWQEKVGFSSITLGQEEHPVMIAPPGDRFILHLCEGFEPVDPGNTGIGFVTDTFDETIERMQAAGVDFPEPPEQGEGGSSAKFADPDGNIFWLIGMPGEVIEQMTGHYAPE